MSRDWTVRPATPDDAPGVAVVHVEGWREAYAGIVPQEILDALSVAQRRDLWTRLLGPERAAAQGTPGASTWVAEAGGTIVGFAATGPARDADAAGLGELNAIYLRASHWDRGIGRALHDAAVASLRHAGFPAATLWVLTENARTRRFYERRGWRADGATKREPVRGAQLDHVRYRVVLTATPPGAAGSKS